MTVAAPAALGQERSPDRLWSSVDFELRRDEGASVLFDSISRSSLDVLSFESYQQVDEARLDEILRPSVAPEESPRALFLPQLGGGYRRFVVSSSNVIPRSAENDGLRLSAWEGRDAVTGTAQVVITRVGGKLFAEVMDTGGRQLLTPTEDGRHLLERVDPTSSRRTWGCLAEAHESEERTVPIPSWGGGERTLRIAVACTGEYTRARGGTVGDAKAGVTFTVQRLNQLYGRDLGLKFQLVPGYEQLLYLDPVKDPFTNADPYKLIGESQSVIDSVIGDANYDVGHTLSTGAGGLASPGIGQTGRKARGVTGRSSPHSDTFDVDYVAHEIGHQLGASHTFNGSGGSCGGKNRNASTAHEPGSGSTILAYAGICDKDNLQGNSDAYFHVTSLQEIRAYLRRYDSLLPAPRPTSNRPPVVAVQGALHIPKGTGFRLRPTSFSDADGDVLTFCWEQCDLGPVANLGSGDPATVPLFRSFLPETSPTRILPRMRTVLDGSSNPSERMPSTGREMLFRLTVRDGNTHGSGVAIGECRVMVDGTAGPFRITAPSLAFLRSGTVQVEWTVAGTDQPPINARTVNIRLSNDDGRTFNYDLLTGVENTGSAWVWLPAFDADMMRLMVESADESFFAVSAGFRVLPSEASASFIPRNEAEPPLEPEDVRRLLRANIVDDVLVTAKAGWMLHADTDQPPSPMDDAGAIAWIKDGQASSASRRILVTGDRQSLSRLLTLLRGTPTELRDVGVLTFSGRGTQFDSYARSKLQPRGFTLIARERTGDWLQDVQLNEQARELAVQRRLLQEAIPKD